MSISPTASIKNTEPEDGQSIWKNRNFMFLWIGNGISLLAFNIFTLCLPILIYQLTQSTLAMGTMRALEVIPNMVLGIIIGVIVDRLNRKIMIILSVSVQIILVLGLISLLFFDMLQLWHLYSLGFFIFICGFIYGNAFHSIIPQIVRRNQLISANASINFISTSINIIGPAMAGFILAIDNYELGLGITVLGMAFLLILTSFITIRQETQVKNHRQQKSFMQDTTEGLKYLFGHKELIISTFIILCINIASASTGAVLLFYALNSFSVSEKEIGFILSIGAIGGLIASVFAKKIQQLLSNLLGIFIFGISLMIAGNMINFFSLEWYWLGLGMLCIGFGAVMINIHYLTLRQKETPNKLLGRVTGATSTIMKLSAPISFISAGFIAEFILVQYIFLGTAIFLITLIFPLIFVKGIKRAF